MFVVTKAADTWHPVIDLFTLNCFICKTKLRMETNYSVLLSVKPNDRIVFKDLKDAYLQIPANSDSEIPSFYGKVFKFIGITFGLTTDLYILTFEHLCLSHLLLSRAVRFGRGSPLKEIPLMLQEACIIL